MVFGWSMWPHSPYNFSHLRKICTERTLTMLIHCVVSGFHSHTQVHFCSQHTKCSNFAFVIRKMSDHTVTSNRTYSFPSSKRSSFTVVVESSLGQKTRTQVSIATCSFNTQCSEFLGTALLHKVYSAYTHL